MTKSFPQIPIVVLDYVRGLFAQANDRVSKAVSDHPAMHEETLDHLLIMELTATPTAFSRRSG